MYVDLHVCICMCIAHTRYGVFPLRGKVANPRDANHEQIMKNEEIKNLKTILGLQQTNKYDNGPAGLRYGHVMLMADLCFGGWVGGWVGG